MNVRLHVERLVLDGIVVEHGQRPVLEEALRGELRRLLAEGGIGAGLSAGGRVPSVTADGIEKIGESDPSQLGRQIARSVYGGIGR